GDDEGVGHARGDLAHLPPLAPVPVTAGAEHDDEPAPGDRTQGLQCGGDRVGFVGVVDDDAEVLSAVYSLHPAGDGFDGGDATGGGGHVEAGFTDSREPGEGVGDVEGAGEA